MERLKKFFFKYLKIIKLIGGYLPIYKNEIDGLKEYDEELKEVLQLHKKWLNDEQCGIRANLSYANLRGVNLRFTDLSNADLRYVNLSDADLRGIKYI